MRENDLMIEMKEYLTRYPQATLVNLGCGLDQTAENCDNGKCTIVNIDLPDVIAVRDTLLPGTGRIRNIGCDLNDTAWFDEINAADGVCMMAAGVFYYFKTEDVRRLFSAMAERFTGAVLAFDSCNERGAKLMRKTWLKEAGITDVSAFFSLESEKELETWSSRFASISAKSYMRGYRDVYKEVGLFHKLMIRFCDHLVKMKIVKIIFGA